MAASGSQDRRADRLPKRASRRKSRAAKDFMRAECSARQTETELACESRSAREPRRPLRRHCHRCCPPRLGGGAHSRAPANASARLGANTAASTQRSPTASSLFLAHIRGSFARSAGGTRASCSKAFNFLARAPWPGRIVSPPCRARTMSVSGKASRSSGPCGSSTISSQPPVAPSANRRAAAPSPFQCLGEASNLRRRGELTERRRDARRACRSSQLRGGNRRARRAAHRQAHRAGECRAR